MALQAGRGGEPKLRSIDDLCAILHPIQRYLSINFLDFTRINGRFAIPSSMLLNVGIVLSVLDCMGNITKVCMAINDRDLTKAQETFAVLGMAFVMTMRGMMLARSRVRLSELYNSIDRIFPNSSELQTHMEVAKTHDYIKRRFFLLHQGLSFALVLFCTMPAVKLVFFYDFEAQEPVADEFHVNPSWVPFQVKETISSYGYIYVYEVILALVAVNMIITWDEVFVVLISQLSVLFFLHFVSSLADELNDLFNLSILVSDMGTAMSICFNLFLVTGAKDYLQIPSYLTPCFVETWLIYDVSKWGTMLETVTARINEVLYEQKWYDSSVH
ncbi:odorant receptor 88a [Ceratitis capitata]|uniref:odorant receptor 88a n=1 Tax=Ceratitis capitata TaxID=7213 RepID=UPI000A1097EF|nr:odorant receptor 88a [Ceratitis capitata]